MIVCFLFPVAAGAEQADFLILVDDRGEPLGSPVEFCFVQDLSTDCVERDPEKGEAPESVELLPFDLLRIEGPDHGPVTVRPRDLPPPSEGERHLAVPRKATLRVRGASESRLTAALHPREDPDPSHPAHSLAVPAEGELKVPAGDWLLALESRGTAPDLHLLAADPGATRTVQYRARGGWSLVLRAVSQEAGEPVEGARVTLRPPEPPMPPDPEAPHEPRQRESPRMAETGAAGLALLPGLEDSVVDAEVRHPDFAPATLPGISSTHGALELREVALGPGATLEATVLVDGEPAAGWRCAVLDRTSPSLGSSREVRAVEAGDDGVCRAVKLPEGTFWLRVKAPEGDAAAEREVRLYDDETASVELELSPIPVEGEVRKGQEPESGYTVRIYRLREEGATYFVEPVAEATTGEEGGYESTLWDTGPHHFSLSDPGGRSVESERAEVQPPVTRVDFRLASGAVEGLVVDEDGRPVAGAQVSIDLRTGSHSAGRILRTGEDGTFRFDRASEADSARVTARHPGYRPATARLDLAPDAESPPLVLTLERSGLLRGRVVTAAGPPAPGVLVISSGAGPPGPGSPRTDVEGRFAVARAEPPPTLIIATGPGCPLTVTEVAAEPAEPVVIPCPGSSASLRVRFVDTEGRPVAGLSVRLHHDGRVLPGIVLAGHLSNLGRPATSDGSGRLVLPGLSPGAYEVTLGSYSTEAAGRAFPGAPPVRVDLVAGEARELEIRVDTEP